MITAVHCLIVTRMNDDDDGDDEPVVGVTRRAGGVL